MQRKSQKCDFDSKKTNIFCFCNTQGGCAYEKIIRLAAISLLLALGLGACYTAPPDTEGNSELTAYGFGGDFGGSNE